MTPVNLATSAELPRETRIVLTLTADEAVHLNDQRVLHQSLAKRLRGHGDDTSVIVRGDRMILPERFVSMVNDIRRIGFDQVNFR